MKIHFHKYQGTGNDFILIDDRELGFPDGAGIVEKLCHRRFGIGADGLILIREHAVHDFEMVYYNADGSQSMCGNGSRCAVHFARQLGMIGRQTTFQSTDGPHQAFFEEELVSIQLYDVTKVQDQGASIFINTGSPHHITFVEDVRNFPVGSKGKEIRHSAAYAPKGTNVNFVELEKDNGIFVRTYERGVEDETLSCGTGVTACSLAASLQGYKSPVTVHTLGGTLEVSFLVKEGGFTNIFLKGPATPVYTGDIDV